MYIFAQTSTSVLYDSEFKYIVKLLLFYILQLQNKRKQPCRSGGVDEATCRHEMSQRFVA